MEEQRPSDTPQAAPENTQEGQHETVADDVGFPTLGEHVRGTFAYTKSRIDLIGWYIVYFAGLFAVFMGLIFLGVVTGAPMEMGNPALFITIFACAAVFFIVGAFAITGGAMYAVVWRDEGVRFREGFVWALRHIIPLGIIGLYTQLVYITGIVLLLIPGLVVAVYLTFSLYVYIREGHRGVHALMRSTDLIRGSFWKVVWRILVVVVPVTLFFIVLGVLTEETATSGGMAEFISGLLTNVLSIVFTVFMFFYLAILMDGLMRQKPTFDPARHPRMKFLYRAMALVGVLVPVAIALALGWAFQTYGSVLFQQAGNMNEQALEEQLIEGMSSGEFEIPGYAIENLTDDETTMFDVWFELDWYHFNNSSYPETLRALEDLPYIPDGVRYEQTGNGSGFELCRDRAEGGEECVTDEDQDYPYSS